MQDSVNQPGFLFHDYETFGTSPSLDRPAQFAAIRTDAELNVLGEPEVFYCKPADDYLPQPQAVMITDHSRRKRWPKGITRPRLPAASTICSRCRRPASSAITTCALTTK